MSFLSIVKRTVSCQLIVESDDLMHPQLQSILDEALLAQCFVKDINHLIFCLAVSYYYTVLLNINP